MAFPLIAGALLTGAVTTIFYGVWAGLIMAGLTLLMGLISPVPKTKLKPASLSDFKVTQADEGQPIPLVYGIVKIPGNIIYYGNLKVEKMEEQAGGKGGGSRSVTVGYKYWIDMWQAICIGKIELLSAFQNDDETKTVSYASQIFNDGTTNDYPTHIQYASRLPGVAHVYWSQFYVGENTTIVPTVYFWVKRILQTGLPYENMTNGSNPAAIVYDLLTNFGGISIASINIDNFQSAATYFYNEGLGINYVVSSTKKIREVVDDILSFVDSYLDYDADGKIIIKIMKKSDASAGTIEDDFIEFTFSKPSWNTVPNHFVANFVEDGKERTLIIENQAAKYYAGQTIREEFDLTVFKERSIALKRLAEIMKRDSYPRIALSLKLPLRYAIYSVGDVVTVKNTELGITGDFRIMATSEPKIEENEIEMQLIQHTDLKFDNYYQNTGGTLWQNPDYTLQKLTKVKVLELDYNPETGLTPTYLIMASRETGFEEGFIVLVSLDGTSYEQVAICDDWFTAGTIVEQYSNTTYDIDDDVGIIFRPYKEIEQKPLSISRQALFVEPRICVVDDEIMLFQNYSPYGTTDYKLTGIVRNVNWSGKATHNANATAFVGYLGNNIVSLDLTSTFYVKVVPIFQGNTGNVSQATAITVTPSVKARTPRPPERLYAVRSGSTVTVDVFAITKTGTIGAGIQNADSYTDTYPFQVEGSFYISTDGTNWELKNTPHFTITNANAFTLRVKHYNNGRYSTEKTLSVGSADGEYIS